jgi:hypothetical protein
VFGEISFNQILLHLAGKGFLMWTIRNWERACDRASGSAVEHPIGYFSQCHYYSYPWTENFVTWLHKMRQGSILPRGTAKFRVWESRHRGYRVATGPQRNNTLHGRWARIHSLMRQPPFLLAHLLILCRGPSIVTFMG